MNEVSCRVLPVLFAALAQRGIETGLPLAGLGFDERRASNPRNRIDWNDFAVFLNRLGEFGVTHEELFAIGREFSARPELRKLTPVFPLADSPQALMSLVAGWLGPSGFNNVAADVKWPASNRATLTMHLAGNYIDCQPFFIISAGALSGGMGLFSRRTAQVTFEVRPRGATYTIEFGDKKPLRGRVLSVVKSYASRRYLVRRLIEQQEELGETLLALRESEQRYRRLLEHSLDGIWQLDATTRRFEFASGASETHLGYTPEEMLEIPLEQIFPLDDLPRVRQLVENVLRGETEHFVAELPHRRKDGTHFWGEVHAGVIRDHTGKVTAIHGVTRDVTERKAAEAERVRALAAEAAKANLEAEIKERERVEAELVAAKEQAEASLRLKASISANLSHEIRTPLTALIGFSQVLAERLKGTEYEPQLQIVQKAGKRLLLLLNNMLDLARLEAGRLTVATESYPIRETVDQVVELLGMQAADQGLELRADVGDDLYVLSDRKRDEQVLLNIVGNAIRFTEQGGIHIFAERQRDGIVLSVQDSGIGISEEFIPYAFEEFRQESEGFNRRHEGSGLGLALSKKLVEAVGGSIQIRSLKQHGTLVEICLPVGPIAPGQAGAMKTPPEAIPKRLPRVQLLVVEDDADSLAYLREALAGCAVLLTAATAQEALAHLSGSPHLDGALLDINLKGSSGDGIALLHAIRERRGFSELPVAAMTAYALPGDRERFLAEGFTHYLAKPVSFEALQSWVAGLISPPVR